MPQKRGQEAIQRDRPPRVHIAYSVALYGSDKKVQLPMVMGVMADLAGKRAEPLPPVAERDFLDIDIDNFDHRLKALRPRVAFAVPNALSGEGNIAVEMTFESLDDFKPDAVARKVGPLRKLLEARERLSHLITYMDGKDSAEQLVGKLLNDKALQQALAAGSKPADADR